MTSGFPDSDPRPVLVLGLGNLLLSDDGVGLRLLDELSQEAGEWGERVEFLDGGTQGLALLAQISERPALVVLDAVQMGAPPGTVHVVRTPDLLSWNVSRAATAHEGNALELLHAAALLGDLPSEVIVIGVEPKSVKTGIGLSEALKGALRPAAERAREVIREVLAAEPSVSEPL